MRPFDTYVRFSKPFGVVELYLNELSINTPHITLNDSGYIALFISNLVITNFRNYETQNLKIQDSTEAGKFVSDVS